eukprot:1591373-Prorocentrum_lima.AAC.1
MSWAWRVRPFMLIVMGSAMVVTLSLSCTIRVPQRLTAAAMRSSREIHAWTPSKVSDAYMTRMCCPERRAAVSKDCAHPAQMSAARMTCSELE